MVLILNYLIFKLSGGIIDLLYFLLSIQIILLICFINVYFVRLAVINLRFFIEIKQI